MTFLLFSQSMLMLMMNYYRLIQHALNSQLIFQLFLCDFELVAFDVSQIFQQQYVVIVQQHVEHSQIM